MIIYLISGKAHAAEYLNKSFNDKVVPGPEREFLSTLASSSDFTKTLRHDANLFNSSNVSERRVWEIAKQLYSLSNPQLPLFVL